MRWQRSRGSCDSDGSSTMNLSAAYAHFWIYMGNRRNYLAFALLLLRMGGSISMIGLSSCLWGVCRLSQFFRNSDDVAEIRRLALNRRPEGGIVWKSPKWLNTTSSRGYSRRDIIPRLESIAARPGYQFAVECAVGKLKHDKEKFKAINPVNGIETLYHIGPNLSKGAKNSELQYDPQIARTGELLFWNYNAKSGCQKRVNCLYTHDLFGGRNVRWASGRELLRRGCFGHGSCNSPPQRMSRRRPMNCGEKRRNHVGATVAASQVAHQCV